LNDYQIVWVEYARDQYLTLADPVRAEFNSHLELLAQEPTAIARYDPGTDRWSSDFDNGLGLVLYLLSPENRRIVILRVLHLA
jgi:plasmid stabilization system protein ParE